MERKIRVHVQLGIKKDGTYSIANFLERDITMDVRDEEDMCKQLRFLMSDEFKAIEKRSAEFSESRPLIESGTETEQVLIG